MPSNIWASNSEENEPAARNALQASVVTTKAGGTGNPSDIMRATDQALPPMTDRSGNMLPSRLIIHCLLDPMHRILFHTFAAKRTKKVFVQFAPHAVIAGDAVA